MSTKLRGTAFHEAGHAAMALYCGWPVAGLTIRPDPTRHPKGPMTFEMGSVTLGEELPPPLHFYSLARSWP